MLLAGRAVIDVAGHIKDLAGDLRRLAGGKFLFLLSMLMPIVGAET